MVAADPYAVCRRIARRHYENFPVASWLVPRKMRPHVAAIYAFARIADDFADEETRTAEARLALIDDWRARLHEAAGGAAVRGPLMGDASFRETADAVFLALGETMRSCALEVQLLDDLLSAFRQDVIVTRYATWEDLLDYCRRSANPVGRLVLRVAGRATPALDELSDAICTGLQLTNFWQDLERDWRKGRLYVPATVVKAAGADERDLDVRRLTPAWRDALGAAALRTRTLFERGRALPDRVPGRLGWELRATWLGGMRVLDRLERGGFDVFSERPVLGWADAVLVGWRSLTWR